MIFFSGIWVIHVYFGEDEVQGSPINLCVNDPQKAWMSGPDSGFVGERVAFKGKYTVRMTRNNTTGHPKNNL